MKYIELNEICSLITRGYKYPKTDLANEGEQGYTVAQISFSDISEDGTVKSSKKVTLKQKYLYHKYKIDIRDILLPPTIKTTAKARMLKHNENMPIMFYKGIYSSNIVILRLKEKNQYYNSQTLYQILNTNEMQQRLLDEVYSKGTLKAISIEKLRHFKIPVITEQLKEELNNSLEYRNKLQQAEQNINNLIIDIMS